MERSPSLVDLHPQEHSQDISSMHTGLHHRTGSTRVRCADGTNGHKREQCERTNYKGRKKLDDRFLELESEPFYLSSQAAEKEQLNLLLL
jgi:hypothetical protein